MRGLYFAAERRSPQHEFAIAEAHEIRQVRMAARELLDGDRSGCIRKMAQQERFEAGEIEFFAGPYRSRMILRILHGALRASFSDT